MVGVLVAVWGASLRRDLRWLGAHRVRRAIASAIVVVGAVATGALAVRVQRAWSQGRVADAALTGMPRRVDRDLPSLSLIDQYGARTSLADLRGRPALVTFAFGHCADICPLIVSDLHAARRLARRPDVPLVVITLDPWRDTPERLSALAGHWELARSDRVLSGSVRDVEAALDALGIARKRNETTGDVDHATTVLILDAHGRIAWRVDGGSGGVADVLARADLGAS
jgi:protein SCO1/2